MSNVLITGSSRGLGLELVQHVSAHPGLSGGLAIATARKCSSELDQIVAASNGSIIFVALDVADEESVRKSAEKVKSVLGGRSLDVIINCAGVHSETHGKLTEMSDLDWQLSVNVSGTHNVLRQYLALMGSSQLKKVVNIPYGSMILAREVAFARCPAYKISKAALNALTVQYATSYEEDGFIFLAVSPGWLKSEMGGQDADLTVAEGAEAVVKLALSADRRDNGSFKNVHVSGWEKYAGQNLPCMVFITAWRDPRSIEVEVPKSDPNVKGTCKRQTSRQEQ